MIGRANKPRDRSGRAGRSILWREFRPYRSELLVSLVLGFFAALTELGVIYLITFLGSSAMGQTSRSYLLPVLADLTPAGLSFVLVGLVAARGVLQWSLELVQERMGYRYESTARMGLLASFIDAEWSQQSTMESGEVYNAVIYHQMRARTALRSAARMTGSAISFVLMLVGSFAFGGLWTVAIIAVTGALAWLLRPFIRASRAASNDLALTGQHFLDLMKETIELARESRLFRVGEVIKDIDGRASGSFAHANLRYGLAGARLRVLYTTGVYFVAATGLAAIILADLSDPAPYVAVVILLYRGMGYGQAVQSAYQDVVSAEPAVTWLQSTRDRLDANALPTSGIAFVPPLESLTFRSVSFAYGDQSPALNGLNFTLRRGDALGVVGPSGSGKSTFVQLILRLRVPTDGQVLANGQDLAAIDPDSWFGQIAFVPQEARLANMTVAENVQWYRKEISRDDVVAALRKAHVLDEVMGLPDGLDTPVGESGSRLSGGQRQRVCIARALVGRPEVMILDEPTSALDLVSEEAIRRTLAELRGRMTLVIIAHRMSTLRICDEVMVLKGGVIETLARREDLEADNEFYSEAIRLSKLV